MFGYYYESDEIKALNFLKENGIKFLKDVEEELKVNPGQDVTITFSILSLLVNKISELEKLEEKIDDKLREHESEYYHNSRSHY